MNATQATVTRIYPPRPQCGPGEEHAVLILAELVERIEVRDRLILALADRVCRQSELLGRRAEKVASLAASPLRAAAGTGGAK